jgi:hypothetical protein
LAKYVRVYAGASQLRRCPELSHTTKSTAYSRWAGEHHQPDPSRHLHAACMVT